MSQFKGMVKPPDRIPRRPQKGLRELGSISQPGMGIAVLAPQPPYPQYGVLWVTSSDRQAEAQQNKILVSTRGAFWSKKNRHSQRPNPLPSDV